MLRVDKIQMVWYMSYYNYCSPIVGKDHLFEHFFRWVETTSYALKYQFIMFCPILLPTALFGLVLYVAQNVGQSKRLVCPFKEHLRQKGWNDWNPHPNHTMVTIPRCFMYGIFTYMHHRFKPNVGKYSIHGASGNMFVEATWELARSTAAIAASSRHGSCWFGIWAIPNHTAQSIN